MADPVTAAAAIGWGIKAAGWVASPIISDLFKKCSSFLGFDASEKLRQLEPKILLLERVMEMVAKSPHRARLQQLFGDLKTAFYEAEDILDDIDYHRLEKEVQDYELNSDGPPSTVDFLKHKIQSIAVAPLTNKETGMSKYQLKQSLEKIEKIINEAHQILKLLNLPGVSKGDERQPIAANARTTATSPVKVIGRDEDRDKIIEMLHEKAGHGWPNRNSGLCYSVVGVHGIGGSGKSTLAQLVYAEEEKDGHFDILLWVHVSQKSSIEAIYRQMFDEIEGYDCELKSLDRLQRQLNDMLSGKRFLLVLDDVWCNKDVGEQNLPQLLSSFKSGKRGSKILATSRNVNAFSDLGPDVRCATIPISDLDDSMFLELFMYHALGDRNSDDGDGSTLRNIGACIAKKLKRSPLAASTVGGQLRKRKNVEFWTRAKYQDLLNETMGALSWSYQHLNAEIRQCFAYCSMFPRGYHLRRDVLVNFWVAEGFIRSTNAGQEMEDVSLDYFDELVSISFLQLGGNDYGGEDYYLMHDLLYDLAERTAGSDCFKIEDGWTGKIPPGVRHLFIDTYNGEKFDMERMKTFQLENVRTLVIKVIRVPKVQLFVSLFSRLQKLRILYVNFGLIMNVDFLENMVVKHIRHLTFRIGGSDSLILQGNFRKLHHIQTLDFGDDRPLKLSEGKDRINFVSLRHVSAKMLKVVNIARSTSLQKLGPSFEVSKKGGLNLKHLRDLNKLRGRLLIQGLENVTSNEEALEAKLADKERLTELVLWWNCDQESCNPKIEVEVLEGLCPPKDLEKLELGGYNGARYPNWMVGRQNGGLKCLQVLKLWKCSLLGLASVFEVFTLLRVLYLDGCICVTLPDNMAHLKSLKILAIYSCPNIQYLPVLPQSLKELSIFSCPDIQSLPVLPQTLEKLYIYNLNIHSLSVLPQSLTKLSVHDCPNIHSLSVLPQSLTKLSVHDCPNIQSLPELPQSLTELSINDCQNIHSLPELPQSLTELSIDRCQNIQSLPVMPQSLTELSINRCQSIQSLPVLPQSLTKLSIDNCPNIQSLPELPQSLEEFELKRCNEVFMRSCETIGDPNWQKIQHIHKKKIGPSRRMRGVQFDDDVSHIEAHGSAGCRCLIL